MSTTIYMVRGATGEYSDHWEWYCNAWSTKEKAEAWCKRLEDEYRRLGADNTWRKYGDARRAADEEMQKLDPGFSCDYTGTQWDVIPVELVE